MKRVLLAVSFALMLLLFWHYAHLEAYCFFYPAIDTTYAAGFSEREFALIKHGMSKSDVKARLGIPLGVQFSNQGDLWSYTRDGKCRWGDWAWLCRQVRFKDGKVTEVIKVVVYN